jgi:hypothetical protein
MMVMILRIGIPLLLLMMGPSAYRYDGIFPTVAWMTSPSNACSFACPLSNTTPDTVEIPTPTTKWVVLFDPHKLPTDMPGHPLHRVHSPSPIQDRTSDSLLRDRYPKMSRFMSTRVRTGLPDRLEKNSAIL